MSWLDVFFGGSAGVAATMTTVTSPTAGTAVLTRSQLAAPILVLDVVLTGNLTVQFLDAVGYWIVDTNDVNLNAHTLTFTAGVGSVSATSGQVYVVVTEGGGVIRLK